MGDSYAEVIVHDEKDAKGLQFKLGLILLTGFLLALGLTFSLLALLAGIVMIPVTIMSIKNRYREYEYLLISGELDITLIKNKQKRKKIKTYQLSEMQCMAPVSSHRLDGFHSNPQLKVLDYSSGNPDHEIYSMLFSSDGMYQEVKVEPSKKMLDGLKMNYPGIVFLD